MALEALKTRMASDPGPRTFPALPTRHLREGLRPEARRRGSAGTLLRARPHRRRHHGLLSGPESRDGQRSDHRQRTPIVDFANGGSAVEWTQILDGVLKLDFEMAIPGRGEPKSRAEVQAFRTQIRHADRARVGGESKPARDRDQAGGAGEDRDDLGWHAQSAVFRPALRRVDQEKAGRAGLA